MTVNEIRERALESYGDFQKYIITVLCGTTRDEIGAFFPLQITGQANGDPDILRYSKANTGTGYSLESETIVTRSKGPQTYIRKIFFESEEDYLSFIDKKKEIKNLRTALLMLQKDQTLTKEELRNWAFENIPRLTEDHRQNVKFWGDIALNAKEDKVEPEVQPKSKPKGTQQTPPVKESPVIEEAPVEIFNNDSQPKASPKKPKEEPKVQEKIEPIPETRVRLKYPGQEKPRSFFIRFRTLSIANPARLGALAPEEMALTLNDFIHLDQTDFLRDITTIILVDTEGAYLSFPRTENCLCIFANAYTLNALKLCQWFTLYRLFYFGTISEFGFDMLSTFRISYPKTEPLCMDDETLVHFARYLEKGTVLKNNSIPRNLTQQEKNTFAALRQNPDKSLLSQDRIPPEYIQNIMHNLLEALPEE
ncbi:MAG: hypothetical protein J6Y16_10695 [Treponema sp.]|nr:hypothetical protein [Treponema sp.]